ncbi:MAG: hypothetical protein GEU97_05845 [Actinophytocola sp.]|nr:hypothetical protein [Actinophytocola sp.]
MAFEKNRVRAALFALPLAVGLSLGAATAAQAEEAQEDPRATVHAGNIDGDQPGVCAKADLGGDVIANRNEEGEDLELITIKRGELDDQQKYLDITAVADDVTVSAIVVKGGPNYNVYVPGEEGDGGEALSEIPPWEDLRAPLNDKGNIPALSHWFVCGSYTPPETSTTTTTSESTTTTTESSETSTTPPETTSSTSEETTTSETSDVTTTSVVDTTPASETSTTDAPVVDNASDSDDLAVTGFGSSWLIWAGVLFLVAGVGAIAGVRVLRKQ